MEKKNKAKPQVQPDQTKLVKHYNPFKLSFDLGNSNI